MKLNRTLKTTPPPNPFVSEIGFGQVFQFMTSIGSTINNVDLYMVLKVPNIYVPEVIKRSLLYPHPYDKHATPRDSAYTNGLRANGFDGFGKTSVVNLRTGLVSFVDESSIVKRIKAEVWYE